jgi:hypothetical protein
MEDEYTLMSDGSVSFSINYIYYLSFVPLAAKPR